MLIITYTSCHNHPDPHDIKSSNLEPQQNQPTEEDHDDHQDDHEDDDDIPPPTTSPKEEQHEKDDDIKELEIKEEPFHYILQSPIRCAQDTVIGLEEVGGGKIEKATSFESSTVLGGFVLDEEPLINMSQFSQHQQQQQQLNMCFSTQKLTEENDFFDELEELPTYSSFTRFMRSHLSDEIMIPIVPS